MIGNGTGWFRLGWLNRRYGMKKPSFQGFDPLYRKPKQTKARKIRAALLAENPACEYCGKALNASTATLDHVLPLRLGGQTTKENAALACQECNQAKGGKTLAEFSLLQMSIRLAVR